MRRRLQAEGPGDQLAVSFLDLLSCGLGAAVLLFLLFSNAGSSGFAKAQSIGASAGVDEGDVASLSILEIQLESDKFREHSREYSIELHAGSMIPLPMNEWAASGQVGAGRPSCITHPEVFNCARSDPFPRASFLFPKPLKGDRFSITLCSSEAGIPLMIRWRDGRATRVAGWVTAADDGCHTRSFRPTRMRKEQK